jgi:hypothetical protein
MSENAENVLLPNKLSLNKILINSFGQCDSELNFNKFYAHKFEGF